MTTTTTASTSGILLTSTPLPYKEARQEEPTLLHMRGVYGEEPTPLEWSEVEQQLDAFMAELNGGRHE